MKKRVRKKWTVDTPRSALKNTCNNVLIRSNSGSSPYFNYPKLLNWMSLLVIVISVVCSVCKVKEWIYNFCYYPISYIIVTGKRYYTTNTDIDQVVTQLGTLGTFLTQDVNIIQKQIESLPWIKQVSVRKQWPDVLKIYIVEYVPLAYWNHSQTISTTGVVFTMPSEKNLNNNTQPIPILYGPDGSEQIILTNYYIFSEILKSSKFRIKSLKMNARCSWQLILENNIHLKLGRNNIMERLYYFIKIYPIIFHEINKKNKCIDYIDLRYHSGFAIRWSLNSVSSVCCNQ